MVLNCSDVTTSINNANSIGSNQEYLVGKQNEPEPACERYTVFPWINAPFE